VFWSILATPTLIIATRNELQKRSKIEKAEGGASD
jgi:hypothetical protein